MPLIFDSLRSTNIKPGGYINPFTVWSIKPQAVVPKTSLRAALEKNATKVAFFWRFTIEHEKDGIEL